MRYFIELSYQGTNYSGWQTQSNGTSIQTKLSDVLSKRLGRQVYVVASGRTDAGVHARQQFVHLDTEKPLPLSDDFLYSLNCMLPPDIAIHAIFPVRDTDHARFSARSRYYQYHITRRKDAFLQQQTLHFRQEVNVELMNEACAVLLRHRNFRSFSKFRPDVMHYECDLVFAYWQYTTPGCLTFHIKANRFLWGMVRTIVGTMLEIGQGRLSLDRFDELILARDRSQLGAPAPANGLYLVEVSYPDGVLTNRPAREDMGQSPFLISA